MKKLHRSDIALLLGDLNTEASLLAWASQRLQLTLAIMFIL